MRSFFEMGFRHGFHRPSMGFWDVFVPLVSAGLQAGSAAYGSYMNTAIARMQAQTQRDIQARQEASEKARQDAQQKQIEQQEAVTTGGGGAAGASSKIMGVDRDMVIMGGVGLALVVGIIAIVASKSSETPVHTAVVT
jgi:hypothetical protein